MRVHWPQRAREMGVPRHFALSLATFIGHGLSQPHAGALTCMVERQNRTHASLGAKTPCTAFVPLSVPEEILLLNNWRKKSSPQRNDRFVEEAVHWKEKDIMMLSDP